VPHAGESPRTAVQPSNTTTLRRAATDAWFDTLIEEWPPERPPSYLPPLLLFLHRRSASELAVFESDVERIKELSPEPRRVGTFVRSGVRVDHASVRQWYGGFAELAVQASLLALEPVHSIRIEPELPNGKVTDAAVLIGDRRVWVEVTALTMSDATYAGFDPAPGVHLGYGDPYYDARRFYRKAFDKVAGGGSTRRSQLHPTEPSLLVVSDGDISMGFGSLGIEWATAQLLDPGQRESESNASLHRWLEQDYPDDPATAERQLRHLTGLAFATYNLQSVEIVPNKAADDAHRLAADELLALSAALQVDRPWTAPPANI
jgi:hypothetical protein